MKKIKKWIQSRIRRQIIKYLHANHGAFTEGEKAVVVMTMPLYRKFRAKISHILEED